MLRETEENLQALEDLLNDRNLELQMEEYTNKVKLLQQEKMTELERLRSKDANNSSLKNSPLSHLSFQINLQWTTARKSPNTKLPNK